MATVHLTEPQRRRAWQLAASHGADDLAKMLAAECPVRRGLLDADCPCHAGISNVAGAIVHASAVVEGVIGPGTTVGPNAWIGSTVMVGRDCMIGPGAQIGGDGFGYTKDRDGRWTRKPESHGVVIADDVHIGANACVDRGSYRHTTIGRGTKIDNGVHVAHNAMIGEDCLIIANSMIAGSVEIGDGAYIAPMVAIREHLTIGPGAFVALGSVVVKDVGPSEHVKGVPAKAFQPTEATRAANPPRDLLAA